MKYFTAETIQEAMSQVKASLGRDAIILHTRTFRKGGIFGFFTKERVEVMAGIDTPAVEKKVQQVSDNVTKLAPVVPAPPIAPIVPIEVIAKTIVPTQELPVEDPKEGENVVAMQQEFANMRTLLEQVLSKNEQEIRNYPALELLLESDIEPHIAERIIKSLPVKHILASPEFKELVIENLTQQLQHIEEIKVPDMGRKIVAFIGPTGVGKTTTIAKLAANFAIEHQYSVALVTADTYRVSAVEQLKTYSDIMGLPIHVVYTPDELKKVLDSNLDKQLILLDTAGRSPHNHEQLQELQKFLQVDDTIEKHLVLSTTTKYRDALDIVEKFSLCSPDKIIFTKIDEARNIGTIINVLHQIPLPLSYVTNGQNVPDDIELVDPKKLAQLIFRT